MENSTLGGLNEIHNTISFHDTTRIYCILYLGGNYGMDVR